MRFKNIWTAWNIALCVLTCSFSSVEAIHITEVPDEDPRVSPADLTARLLASERAALKRLRAQASAPSASSSAAASSSGRPVAGPQSPVVEDEDADFAKALQMSRREFVLERHNAWKAAARTAAERMGGVDGYDEEVTRMLSRVGNGLAFGGSFQEWQELAFCGLPTHGDGDCGYYALGVTRDEIVSFLKIVAAADEAQVKPLYTSLKPAMVQANLEPGSWQGEWRTLDKENPTLREMQFNIRQFAAYTEGARPLLGAPGALENATLFEAIVKFYGKNVCFLQQKPRKNSISNKRFRVLEGNEQQPRRYILLKDGHYHRLLSLDAGEEEVKEAEDYFRDQLSLSFTSRRQSFKDAFEGALRMQGPRR